MAVLESAVQTGLNPKPPASRRRLAWRRFARNRLAVMGLVWVGIFILFGIIGPWIAPYTYTATDTVNANMGPSAAHWFGTDSLGHDMFSEILYSIRFACIIGFGATAVAFIIGAILGLLAGVMGGVVDNIIMRLVDLMFAFPAYFLNLILVIDLGRGLLPIFISIGITQWSGYARLIRGLVLSLRGGEMVEAAISLGATKRHIALHYLFPNIIGSVIVSLSLGIPYALIQDAGLSVVGLGLRPPMPSFGNLVTTGAADMMGYPWLLVFPAVLFAITLLAFLFVGNGLQEAFNTKGASK
ncbi:MAG: ABC transporter permease [Alicyclobacillus herbarius]|uniref:ABC transporter permease n=1 Tax=Alicyclobacillus herbarius TaxID=122960 RepID=UPI0023577252|nr:ABC transporter permease [Alicyclobacillus herbarius]MCL6632436.1 ABC transporter permease [Alicyclobacillus herbarius]